MCRHIGFRLSGEYRPRRGRILWPHSFSQHFRDDENEDGSAQSAPAKKINRGIASRGEHRRYQKCYHKCEWIQV